MSSSSIHRSICLFSPSRLIWNRSKDYSLKILFDNLIEFLQPSVSMVFPSLDSCSAVHLILFLFQWLQLTLMDITSFSGMSAVMYFPIISSIVIFHSLLQKSMRSLWSKYYKDAHGIVFIIDSTDEERIKEARDELSISLSPLHSYSFPLYRKDLHV